MADDDLTVLIDTDAPDVREGPGGSIEVELEDGGLKVYPDGLPSKPSKASEAHDANLADGMDETYLGEIAAELIEGFEADLQSRTGWMNSYAAGEVLLGLKLEKPRQTPDGGNTNDGLSTVRSPLLLEAVLRFQANASAELLPSTGPVKVWDTTMPLMASEEARAKAENGGRMPENRVAAETLELAVNEYLTVKDREYYPDVRRMLLKTGFGGCGFRKVYRCPLKRRPVSRTIEPEDLIVADPEVSIQEAGRVTHRIMMRKSTLRRLQLAGHYLDVPITPPVQEEQDPVKEAESDITGLTQTADRPADIKHEVLEMYCELDLRGFEHKEKRKSEGTDLGGDESDDEELEASGLALPYVVSIERHSRQVLEIRRNWKEGDEEHQRRIPVVKYPFVEGFSFYGIGLLHILGNSTMAVTGAWRLALDSGMMASFPAFLYSDVVNRQNTNVFRLVPGGGTKINTGGQPIRDAIMPAPYHDATPGLISMMQHVEQTSARVGGTAEVAVGEGRQDAPVGTTVALIDQATKILSAVHKGDHAAQAEEFGLLRELLLEDPTPLLAGRQEWEKQQIIQALQNFNLVPQADPNTPSHMVRVMRAMSMIQLYQMNPEAWDFREIAKRITRVMGENDVDALFAPPPDPNAAAADPMQIAAQAQAKLADAKLMEVQQKPALEGLKQQTKLKEIKSKERVEAMKVGATVAIHPEQAPLVERTISRNEPRTRN